MKHNLHISPDAAGGRADKFVAAALPAYSRSFWQKQFAAGHITLDSKPLKGASQLTEGEIVITVPDTKPTPLDIHVIYEDVNVLVLNKQAGVLTHAKGVVNEEATVADFVRPHTTDAPESNRPGIVHRLDRDTSGILIAAKNPETKRQLQKQFAERKAKKTYLALVEGILEPAKAIVRLPIERNPKSPQKFRVGAGGKPAETSYEVVEYFPKHTLVELKPLTGRTHQLRVHLAYLGHPIVGDRIYGKEAKKLPGRLFLHATALEITIPQGDRRTFSAPLAPELQTFLKEIK